MPNCSCMEIAGEDPRCIRHGKGTQWAKENPDLCEISERLTSMQAREATLIRVIEGEALDPSVAPDENGYEDALRAWYAGYRDCAQRILEALGTSGLVER
jgi:hypothetical protein